MANPTSLSGLCCFRARFFYLPLACPLSPRHRHTAALGAEMINLTGLAPLCPLAWPGFIGLLCLRCFCSCCSFPLRALALFWLQQQQLFTLFICHIRRRRQEELGEGTPCLSMQVCVRVCVCECVNTSLMHKQKQAGSSLAASCQKEERKVPNLISARELLVRELETFPLCRALKKVKALFKFFMAPLHLQRAEVISPRKRYVY